MQFIQYMGTAHRRLVLKIEWLEAKVWGQDTVEWNRGNGFTVDASTLQPNAVALLAADTNMRVVSANSHADAVSRLQSDKRALMRMSLQAAVLDAPADALGASNAPSDDAA